MGKIGRCWSKGTNFQLSDKEVLGLFVRHDGYSKRYSIMYLKVAETLNALTTKKEMAIW